MEEKTLEDLYLEIKSYKKESIKFYGICIASIITFFITMGFLISDNTSTPAVTIFGILTIMLLGYIFWLSKVKSNSKMNLKSKLVNYFLSSRKSENKRVLYLPEGNMKRDFVNSNIYSEYNNLFFTDQINIGTKFKISNTLAVYKTDESRVVKFDGVFVCVQNDEFYENEIIIKPDFENKYVSSLMLSKDKLLGNDLEKVYLENMEFEKYFEVYSKNQIKTRELVTPKYMEDLLSVKFKLGVPIKIIYKGDMKYIAIWNKKILNDKIIFKKNLDLKVLKDEFNYIVDVCEDII